VIQINQAEAADLDRLSEVIAEAFLELPPSTWLIEDARARRQIFPSYFRLYLEHALVDGIIHTTADKTAAALWLPIATSPAAELSGYHTRLTAITWPWTERFLAFDAALDRRHPADVPHHHLAILAVHPSQQGNGIGTALLQAHHRMLDQVSVPAYVEASSPRNRDLYLRHGYTRLGAPIQLPHGPLMHPLWRTPQSP
jgi:ribosomal protein S18 acetylase RimI-like enzyme